MTERGTDKDKEGQTRTKSDRQEQRVTDRPVHKEGPHDMVMAEGGTDKAKEGHTETRWVVKTW